MKNLNIFTLLFVAFLCAHLAHCDLRFVFSQFRHGARAPTRGVDHKTNIDYFGEEWHGEGELTPAGKRMHYLLGLRNRQVYKNFATRHNVDGSVYIRSTDYNRTIESVQSQMHGFFPPGTGDLIKNKKTRSIAHPFIDDPWKSNWTHFDKFLGMRAIQDRPTTVPIHLWDVTNPFHDFVYHPYNCKPYYGWTAANMKRGKIAEFRKKFVAEYGERFKNMTGVDDKWFDNYWNLFGMFDCFISDVYDGRELKKPQQFGIDIAAFNRTAFEFAQNDILDQFNGDDDLFFARWSMSIMWPEVISWMEKRIAADQAQNYKYSGYDLPRFAFFSTHDVTVGSGLRVLNKAFGFKLYYTPFASDIFFELHNNHKGEYRVVVKYQSLTLGTVPFNEFKSKLEALFMTRQEIAKTCGWTNVPDVYMNPPKSHH